MSDNHRRLVIIGSGPAGYTAALYASRANLYPLVYEGFYSGPAGGQLMTTTDVENYPGFPEGVSGPEIMLKFRAQAARFGTDFLIEDVLSIKTGSRPFEVIGSSHSVTADSIIIATGATAKRLDIPGTRDSELWSKGVSACAICDGAMPLFRDRPLFVIGGGDSAMEEALFLTKYASKVSIIHRRDELRASKIMGERAKSHSKVEILWNSVTVRVEGDQVVESITLKNVKSEKETTYEAAGVFFAIGHIPNTAFLEGQITTDPTGYIVLPSLPTSYTNVEGVFAAGDVADPRYRQAVTAAGSGCVAAMDVERWLTEQGLSEE